MASSDTSGLSSRTPRERIDAIADQGTMESLGASFDAPRSSPHLARWGIAPQADDGVVIAGASVSGQRVMIAAQDERFLRGSVGANHGAMLARLFEHAHELRPAAVVILAASAGVRLHEANPAELSLARAVRALLDLRAGGVPVLAISVGDTFGGSSVLVCAAERTAFLPRRRLGLSGPAVIEAARGRTEVDAADVDAVSALFGAEARVAAGHVEILADDAEVARAWIASSIRNSSPFPRWVHDMQRRLATRLTSPRPAPPSAAAVEAIREIPERLAPLYENATRVDDAGRLFRLRDDPVIWLAYPDCTRSFGPSEAHALDAALLTRVARREDVTGQTLFVVGDTLGHEASRSAESLCVSQYLAQHAAVLALLRAEGVAVKGLLFDVGHSAAFFSNVLQATEIYALADARVVAMEPSTIARVTRLPAPQLLRLIENDPAVGHPVRHFASYGGVDAIVPSFDRERLMELAARRPS
jgi:malonate decarboxylase beta subunit